MKISNVNICTTKQVTINTLFAFSKSIYRFQLFIFAKIIFFILLFIKIVNILLTIFVNIFYIKYILNGIFFAPKLKI